MRTQRRAARAHHRVDVEVDRRRVERETGDARLFGRLPQRGAGERLVAGLAVAAEGYATAWLDVDPSGSVTLPPDAIPLGVLAIGRP